MESKTNTAHPSVSIPHDTLFQGLKTLWQKEHITKGYACLSRSYNTYKQKMTCRFASNYKLWLILMVMSLFQENHTKQTLKNFIVHLPLPLTIPFTSKNTALFICWNTPLLCLCTFESLESSFYFGKIVLVSMFYQSSIRVANSNKMTSYWGRKSQYLYKFPRLVHIYPYKTKKQYQMTL